MMFSIIITCYNGKKYIARCIKSILEQTYENFELLFIDDGSVDDSFKEIKKYCDKRIKPYFISNHGISFARNYAIDKAKGSHLIFVDVDDWINPNLLENIKNNINNNDMLRYQAIMVDDSNNLYEKFITSSFDKITGIEALTSFCKKKEIFSPAWLYCYKLDFWKKNNFRYPISKLQEDFALTSYILMKALTITSIPYIGYNYYKSDNSIMRNSSEIEELQKAKDVMEHCDNLFMLINNESNDKNLNKEFLYYAKWVLENKLVKLNDSNRQEMIPKIERLVKKWTKVL